MLTASACAKPPAAEQPSPQPPVLSGRVVMLMPAQAGQLPRADAPAAPELTTEERARLDAEIADWMAERGSDVRWVPAAALRRAHERNPALDVRLDSLPTASFRRAEVRRIGDPLFGEVYRIAQVAGGEAALLPWATAVVPQPDGNVRVEVAVALLEVGNGRVLWLASIAGEPAPRGSPEALASAAQALARALMP